jgi:small-conductance mechanosensitive channel
MRKPAVPPRGRGGEGEKTMHRYSSRSAVVLSALLLTLATTRVPAEENSRITQIETQIASTKTLMAEATNDVERAQWSQRVALLEQDLESVRRRLTLEEKEKALVAEHRRRSSTALTEALQAVDINTAPFAGQAKKLNQVIRQLRADRVESEAVRADLQKNSAENSERIADVDMRLRNQDEEIRARQYERDTAELRVRLGAEANRIDEAFRSLPVNPRPSIRLIFEKRRYLDAETKQLADSAVVLDVVRQRHNEISAAVTLTGEKLSHSDQEIAILQKKKEVMGAKSESRHMLYVTVTEKRLLSARLESEQQQLTAVEDLRGVASQLRDLYEKEVNVLREDYAALLQHYWRLLLVPIGTIAILSVLRLLISRLVLPLFYHRDNLFVARRLAQYLLVLAVILTLALFFLEDLKQVATVLGIASAAVVIALQDMCSAFAGWFVIVAGRKFVIGDRVEIDGHRGDIIDIQLLRTTLLEVNNWLGVDEATGRVVVIPNNFVFKTQVFNYSHVHPYVWNKVDITVTFETPAADAQALLLNVLTEETKEELAEGERASHEMERRYGVPDTDYKPKMFSFIEDSGVTFRLIYVSHYRKSSSTRNRLNARIIAEFAKDPRMQFAYPTQRHIPTPEHGVLRAKMEGKAGS